MTTYILNILYLLVNIFLNPPLHDLSDDIPGGPTAPSLHNIRGRECFVSNFVLGIGSRGLVLGAVGQDGVGGGGDAVHGHHVIIIVVLLLLDNYNLLDRREGQGTGTDLLLGEEGQHLGLHLPLLHPLLLLAPLTLNTGTLSIIDKSV